MKSTMNIARKYALAYLNVIPALTLDDYFAIKKASTYLALHGEIAFWLTEYIDSFITYFNLPPSIKKVIELLIADQRLLLLQKVLQQITYQYLQRAGIMEFTITTAQPLTEMDQKTILEFLKKETDNQILYTTHINHELIAGMRIQSDSLLWEESIRKKLNAIERTFKESYGY